MEKDNQLKICTLKMSDFLRPRETALQFGQPVLRQEGEEELEYHRADGAEDQEDDFDSSDEDDGEDPFKAHRDRNPANIPIAERESAYQAKGRATRELSPERQVPFSDATPARGFREAMGSNVVDRERDDLLKKIAENEDDKGGKKRKRHHHRSRSKCSRGRSSGRGRSPHRSRSLGPSCSHCHCHN